MARQQSHQRGWGRCVMISHVGLLSRLSQSEWIWNRVILTRHQSPVIQSFSLQSRSPKELEVQDRFVRTAMTRKSRWRWHQRICLKRQSQGKISLHTVRSLARLSNFLQMIGQDWPEKAIRVRGTETTGSQGPFGLERQMHECNTDANHVYALKLCLRENSEKAPSRNGTPS